MKRNILLIGSLMVVAAAVIALMNMNSSDNNEQHTNDGQSAQVMPGPNEVIIQDFAFNPEKRVIKKGTTITWKNQDSARHDIMPDEESNNFKASELLGQGESYSFTFNEPGTYSYHCSPHPYMKAVIEVTE
jgi:plastocyanin